MIQSLRIWLACRRLEKLIKARRDSFECVDYRKRRAAGKVAWAHRQADRAGREPSRKRLGHTATIPCAGRR